MSRPDKGYSAERCRDALRASEALVAGAPTGSRRLWVEAERRWRIQLAFAEARERA
jgi:hypothetical protein